MNEQAIVFGVSLAGVIISSCVLVFGFTMLGLQLNEGYSNVSVINKVLILGAILLNILLLVFFAFHLRGVVTITYTDVLLNQ